MATKVIKARHQLLRGTTAEWEAKTEFIPLEAEPVVYTDYKTILDTNGSTIVIPGLKIGDGVTAIANLPFLDSGTNSGQNVGFDIVYCDKASNTPKDITFGNVTGALDASENTLNKIYLVPSVNDENDVYDEYITVAIPNEGYKWERLGGLDASNIIAKKLNHSITFGNNGEFTFDGSQDVVVPTYDGSMH